MNSIKVSLWIRFVDSSIRARNWNWQDWSIFSTTVERRYSNNGLSLYQCIVNRASNFLNWGYLKIMTLQSLYIVFQMIVMLAQPYYLLRSREEGLLQHLAVQESEQGVAGVRETRQNLENVSREGKVGGRGRATRSTRRT